MQPHIVLRPSANSGVTVSSTYGVGLPTPANNVIGAILTVETADVRMRWDGTTPLQTGVDGSTLMRKDSVWEVLSRDLLTSMKFVPVSDSAFIVAAYLKGD